MSLRRGWTLMEMVVTIGVMGVLLALVSEITILTIKATNNLKKNIELQEKAIFLIEKVIGGILRAEEIKLEDGDLIILSDNQEIIVNREFTQGNFSGEWNFEWVKKNILRLRLKLKDERGREEIVETEVFIPLHKRGEEL
jgi:prepilin-type N-terminal cleavage/methylation domain-containing protein